MPKTPPLTYGLLSKENISNVLLEVPNCKVIGGQKCLESFSVLYQYHVLQYYFIQMWLANSGRVPNDPHLLGPTPFCNLLSTSMYRT